MSDEPNHVLTLQPEGKKGRCGCGQPFTADSSVKLLKEWQAHLESFDLLQKAREHFERERAAREAGEAAIRRLLALGVAARQISDAIGKAGNDKYLISPTVIQRLGRNQHEQTPRRRRRATAE